MKSIRYSKLFAFVGLSLIGVLPSAFAQNAPNLASAASAREMAGPMGTFEGGLDIISCSGPGCQGGLLATFTGDGHVKLKWKAEAEAYAAMQTGKRWAQQKTMEDAGYGVVRTNADGTVSFDNGAYNRFDNCQFDGTSLTRCYFSRADNGQAVAWITFTKVH